MIWIGKLGLCIGSQLDKIFFVCPLMAAEMETASFC